MGEPLPPPGPAPVALHCPRCRAPDGQGGLRTATLELGPGEARCPTCAATYRVAGRVVEATAGPVADPLGALEPGWPPPAEAWCEQLARLDPRDLAATEAWLLGTFAVAQRPDHAPSEHLARALREQGALGEVVAAWLRRRGGVAGPILELGCGTGGLADTWLGLTADAVVLCDLRAAHLRLADRLLREGRVTVPWRRCGRRYEPLTLTAPAAPRPRLQLVVGDALDPPFPAHAFGLVAALNLVDTVRDPWMLLGQLDALVAPGGALLLATPYHLEAQAQPPSAWIEGPDALRGALAGGLTGLEHLRFVPVAEADGVPWVVPSDDRLAHRYAAHVMLLERR